MQLHLVDATYELFRAHFAPRPPVLGRDGDRPVGRVGPRRPAAATCSASRARRTSGCATDRVIESFRNDLYPGYKTSAGMPPELLAQFPIAEAAIEALGDRPVADGRVRGRRRDRAPRPTGSPPTRASSGSSICTPDKDMAQLVRDERIVLWDRRRELIYDDAGVRAKWGVPPESVPDRLALVGDAADGYPGLPGWGDKTAAAVLARYGHFEQIPEQGLRVGRAGRPEPRRAGGDPARPDGERRSSTATWPGSARPPTAWRSRSRTSTSSSGTAPTARRWEAFCDEWGLDRLRSRPHRWLGEA